MSVTNSNSTPDPVTHDPISEPDRCRFTSAIGRRCANPLNGSATGFCTIHERMAQSLTDTEVRAISDELLLGGPRFNTRESLNLAMSTLFRLVTQKRISRSDGALLAYIASLLLQTISPSSQPTRPRIDWGGFLDMPDRKAARDREAQSAENDPNDPSDCYFKHQQAAEEYDPADGYRGPNK